LASEQRNVDPAVSLEASRQNTLAALTQIDDNELVQLTRLTLPEIQAAKQEVAKVLPAGNLPAFVLSGLLKLKGRVISPNQMKEDLNALMRGVGLIPRGIYGAFIAGPATVLYAYQKLVELAGKDPASAFPYGTWQFYLQMALREDVARHANETVGFQNALPDRHGDLNAAAAWVCAIIELLYSYDDLLTVDWTERVVLRLILDEATEAKICEQPPFASLIGEWSKARPYHRPSTGSDYVSYRKMVFQQFIQERLNALPSASRESFQKNYKARLAEELAAYQEQMTMLAVLDPDRYLEQKQMVPLWQAAIGFIWKGYTYLLPVCQYNSLGNPLCYLPPADAAPMPLYMMPDGTLCDEARRKIVVDRLGQVFYQDKGQFVGRLRPPDAGVIKGWLAAIMGAPDAPSPRLDLLLAQVPRQQQAALRQQLPSLAQAELGALRRAPVLLNWDLQAADQSLAHIRRNHRGVGDHALTIFRTAKSMVFDQSHIFFDGIWGMAVAEILTHQAIYWQSQVGGMPTTTWAMPPTPLSFSGCGGVEEQARAAIRPIEAAGESGGVDTQRLTTVGQWLRQRGVRLTINDLLLLYRFFHARQYSPSLQVRRALDSFQARALSPEAQAAVKEIDATLTRFRETPPALLIPMDASNVSPKERIFPTTFRTPLTDTIQDQYAATFTSYMEYRTGPTGENWTHFDVTRRELLAYLKAFGEVMDALKAVTMRGESFSTATIRLLGHLPVTMQYLLDQVPQRIGMLNEIIKGNEVFSNVGRVAPGSSLTRFISAKDDGQAKEMVWGFITDDQGQMRISLRDFRPFVPLLLAIGESALADQLAQDYVDSYVKGFNRFLAELGAMVALKAPPK